MTLKELKEKRRAHIDAAKALFDKADGEDRSLTDEERVEYDAELGKAEGLRTRIEDLERIDEEDRAIPANAVDVRALSLGSVDEPQPHQLKPVPAVAKSEERDWGLGHFLLACREAKATGGRVFDKRLQRGAVETRQTGASEGVMADGGFLVQTQHVQGLIQNAYDGGHVLSRVKKIGIGPNANGLTMNGIAETSRADGSRWGGALAYWLGEAGVKTDSKPTFRQIELNLKKLAALFYATDELLQDAVALGSIANDIFAKEIQFTIEDSIINGTGAGMPLGIMASPCLVTVPAEPLQAVTTIVAENVMNMYTRMLPESVGNAVWFINQDCWQQLFQMSIAVGAGGAPLFIPAGGLSAAPYGTLMGRPIIPIEFCATLGTTGDIIFADLSHYLMITKGAGAGGGIQADSSIHVKFTYDETVFRWVMRTDGQPDMAAPLTPYLSAVTLSPFVALAGRP